VFAFDCDIVVQNMIASTVIIEYLTSKFEGIGKFSSNEQEFLIPSIFRDNDSRLKLSINVDTGLWQDFLSSETGNFIQLYSILEGKSYHASESVLLIKSLFKNDTKRIPQIKEKINKESKFSSNLIKINSSSCYSEEPLVQEAWSFLFERKLLDLKEDKLFYFVEKEGRYKNRLIIPFLKNEVMFYFQARALGDAFPKYLNPSVDEDILKPSTILYPYDEAGASLVVCEGPFDAISLQLQGINATCTMGCSVSEIQMEILKDFEGEIILGYDNDTAGCRGIQKFDRLRKCKMLGEISVCTPPPRFKDWNEAHVKDFDLKKWIDQESVKYDYEYKILNSL